MPKRKPRQPDGSDRSGAVKKGTTKAGIAARRYLSGEILPEESVHLMTQYFKETLALSFPGLPPRCFEMAEDMIRSSSLTQKIQKAREGAGLTIKEVAARLKVPQYRLRDAEEVRSHRIVPEIFERYTEFLGLRDWVDEWINANSDLARRMGIVREHLP